MKKQSHTIGYSDINKTVKIKKKKRARFIVTTCISSAKVHEGFIHAMEYYAGINDAEIFLLAGRRHNQSFEAQEDIFDEWAYFYNDYGQLVKNIIFNENLEAIDLQLNPQNQNPLGGCEQFGRGSLQPLDPEEVKAGKHILSKSVSFIVAHPSQDLKTLETGNERHPRIVSCTGACTYPDYRSNTQGKKGESNHVIGALIVEIVDENYFFIRQIQADKQGGFVDLGVYYGPDGKTNRVNAELHYGDYHPGFHDEHAIKATLVQRNFLKPNKTFHNDFKEGASVSHHVAKSVIHKAHMANHQHFKDLKSEVMLARKLILMLGLKDGVNIMIPSNHPDFVERRLHEGKYPFDHVNFELFHELALAVYRKPSLNVPEFLLDLPNNYVFPSRDEDVYSNGHIVIHGDMGKSGAKGSAKSFANGYRKSISFHTHSPQVFRGSKIGGTLTQLRMGYNHGMQHWLHCNIVTYVGGHWQMLFIINGRWKL